MEAVQVKVYLSAEIVTAEIKAVKETVTSKKYQVSFDCTALITPDQIVES
jgi:hypothetical protein